MLNPAHSSPIPLVVGAVVIAGFLFAALRRKHQNRKPIKGASAAGWGLLFLMSGRMPPPPPETQIEQDLNAKNNRSESAGEGP
jgi:hypothetical protein